MLLSYFDAHANFAYSTVDGQPSPPLSGTSLTVRAGDGVLFPATPFNVTVWPPNVMPLASNAEIVRVTSIVGDLLTITRQQEGTSARAVQTGWQIAETITSKVITDIEMVSLNVIAVLVSLLWGAPGAQAGRVIEVAASTLDFTTAPLASSLIDVQIIVSDGAADAEPSHTATLAAASAPIGTVLAGSGTATLTMRTDASGNLKIAVTEPNANFRYLWLKNGGNARLWPRSAAGVPELIFV